MNLAELIGTARNNHSVVVERNGEYELLPIDVSPVVVDRSWHTDLAGLLSKIGVQADLTDGREFVFFRLTDVTGVSSQLIGSGPRIVVAGVELPNGALVFVWFGSKVPSLTIHTSIENAMLAHGHGLETQFVYV